MPIYEFQCKECGEIGEMAFRISDCPDAVQCTCGGEAPKIISRSAVQCDGANDVSWLKSAEQVIKPDYEKPWESRKDYKECLKRNGLEPGR